MTVNIIMQLRKKVNVTVCTQREAACAMTSMRVHVRVPRCKEMNRRSDRLSIGPAEVNGRGRGMIGKNTRVFSSAVPGAPSAIEKILFCVMGQCSGPQRGIWIIK